MAEDVKVETKKAKTVGPTIDMRRPRQSGKVILAAVKDEKWNDGMLTQAEWDASGSAYNLYQPVLIENAGKVKCNGRGETVATAPRFHHCRDLTARVAEGMLVNVPKIGKVIIGTVDHPAIFSVNAQTTGSYRAAIEVAKRLCFAGIDLSNIVGLIQTGNRSERLENGSDIVWTNRIVWGHLVRGSTQLSYAEISAITDNDGISFVKLAGPIVGNPVKVSDVVREIRKLMSKAGTKNDAGETAWDRFGYTENAREAAESAIMTNIQTLQRGDPVSMECFGLRSVQCGMPIFRVVSGTVDKSVENVNMAIGCRLPEAYAKNMRQFRSENKVVEVKSPKAPKVPKDKKTPKSDVPKVKVAKKSKKAVEATAPVVEDTAGIPVEVVSSPVVDIAVVETTAAAIDSTETSVDPVA